MLQIAKVFVAEQEVGRLYFTGDATKQEKRRIWSTTLEPQRPAIWSDLADQILTTLEIADDTLTFADFEKVLDCLQNLPATRQYTEHGEYITEFAEVSIESPFGNHKVRPHASVKLGYWPK
ncbi:MAG: hypothetical protein EBR79_03840 [Proteobacteria bacterium]|nr:hypothetical protein [Pseudomonadota bacterium]